MALAVQPGEPRPVPWRAVAKRSVRSRRRSALCRGWQLSIARASMAVLAMALFGMGHGVLIVSFGFVTNLYFRAETLGRPWESSPRRVLLVPQSAPVSAGFFSGCCLN